ncbi:MAG: D-glycerate dehydrogenase [Acidobacteria bacterium]|nr:D-glycerate dehydrogenase [Acidobacteriota bacterium]
MILITRRIPSSVLARLREAGEVEVHAGEQAIGRTELVDRIRDKRALVCLLTDRIDREVIEAAPSLRVIANIAVGYNNIDVDHARSCGIVVTNTPDVLTEAVADFTWGLILALTRRVVEGDRVVRRGAWKGWALDFMLGSELRGKQLGVIGMGRIGQAVAARAPALGMTVATVSERALKLQGRPAGPAVPKIAQVSFDELITSSHVLTLHVPLTAETTHLIDARVLARMRRSAYLVNTSRGSVVDEAALAWALRGGLIAGAALDVYEREPAVHPDLIGLENVILAPHLASATIETRTAMADLAATNVLRVLAGMPALTPV